MPRSPSEATRFTATGPYASTKPPPTSFNSSMPPLPTSRGSQIDIGTRAPTNESPQQKIARLRAAAQATKRLQETTGDKIVRIGRVWANRAHRVTVFSLIGFTVISGVVATAGITDMLIHNRRRRNEWFAEQVAKHNAEVAEARHALVRGVATDDHILLLNRERAADEALEAKRNRPGVMKRTTNWLFGGMAKEEQKGGRLGSGGSTDRPTLISAAPSEEATPDVFKVIEDKINSKRRQGEQVEKAVRPMGGPLDQQAQLAVNTAADSSRSWMAWLRGR